MLVMTWVFSMLVPIKQNMTDTDETEISLLEGPSGHSPQGFLHGQTSMAGAVPHNGDPKTTSSGSPSQRPSKRKAKTRSTRLPGRSCENAVGAEAQGSPAAEPPAKLPMPEVDLNALSNYRCRSVRPALSKAERRRCRERGRQFPFAESFYRRGPITLRTARQYEHSALKGFFNYVKQLKYEHHLKKSLTQLNVGDDLENEYLESRKHKYLDDDGPLSPIEETEDDQNENSHNTEDIGARIVENSRFILSSKIPKKKSKKKTKKQRVWK
ncbi:hypothetical protein lerEdw1_005910 [Lerista edwardsae]|nr:hypothetical protein lerEdw1_005910 [Lerista edwardsae]